MKKIYNFLLFALLTVLIIFHTQQMISTFKLLDSFRQFSFSKIINVDFVPWMMTFIQVFIAFLSVIIQSLFISFIAGWMAKQKIRIKTSITISLISDIANTLLNIFIFSLVHPITFQTAIKIGVFPTSGILISFILFFYLKNKQTQIKRRLFASFFPLLVEIVLSVASLLMARGI